MTLNDKLILEPYGGSGKIESKVIKGFSTIKQKSTLIGLKCLLTTEVMKTGQVSINIEKGQTVYFKEEILHSSDWSKTTYDCDVIEGKFIIAEAVHAVFVK